MKLTQRFTAVLLLVLAGIMLSACAGRSEITHSYVDPVLKKKNLSGVLVVAVAQKESARVEFEDSFVTALERHGTRAVASHTLITGTKSDAEAVIAAAAAAKLDTILLTRYMGAASEEVYHPGTIYYDVAPAYGAGYYGGFPGYYGHAYEVAYQQPVWTSNTTHTLVSDLYIASTKEHVWQAVSDTIQAGSTDKLRRDAIKGLIGNLKDQGLLD